MSENEKLINELKDSLGTVFGQAIVNWQEKADEKLEEHKKSINSNARWLIGIVVGIAFSLILAAFAWGGSYSKQLNDVQIEVGYIDGALRELHPESKAFGYAADKYILTRGAKK